MYSVHHRRDRKTSAMAATSITFDFEFFHRAGAKHQSADALSHLITTIFDRSPLDNDLPVLMISNVHPEGWNTKPDSKTWYSLPLDDSADVIILVYPRFYRSKADLTKSSPLQQAKSWLNRRRNTTAEKLRVLWASQFLSTRTIGTES